MLTLDLLVNGLIIGVFYALMAIGLSLIFGILKVVNFAHGEFYMVGAYAYTLSALALGVSPWIALPLAFLAGGLLGLAVERLLMRPLYAGYASWGLTRDEYAVIVTFGLSLLLVNLVDKVIGPYAYKGPALVSIARVELGPVAISGHRLVATVVALVVILAVMAVVRHSLWGRQIQAVAQNRLGASLAGIDTAKASAIVFALAGALAAMSGALLANIFNPTPDVGVFPAIKSYVIVVLGGMGSVGGSIAASLLLGVIESFGSVYLSYQYRDTFGLVILILFLLFRPQGLFGMIGAYATGLLAYDAGGTARVGIPAAIVVSGAIGFALARVVMRLRGPYLALTTLSFAEITRLVISNSIDITRGDLGLEVPGLIQSRLGYYDLMLGVLTAVQLGLYVFLRSPAGLYLRAIRDDEIAAAGRGVRIVFFREGLWGLLRVGVARVRRGRAVLEPAE